jgi:hypothetical protein
MITVHSGITVLSPHPIPEPCCPSKPLGVINVLEYIIEFTVGNILSTLPGPCQYKLETILFQQFYSIVQLFHELGVILIPVPVIYDTEQLIIAVPVIFV